METESSLQNVVFQNMKMMIFVGENRTMDNVQKHNIYDINAALFWDVMMCSVVNGYQWFGRPCSSHLQCTMQHHITEDFIVFRILKSDHETHYLNYNNTIVFMKQLHV
jgi:hypothetical protein